MSGSVKSVEEHNREDTTCTPPGGSECGTESISTFNNDHFITSPVQFEGPDGVQFDVKDVVVDEYELVTNFEGFLVSYSSFIQT